MPGERQSYMQQFSREQELLPWHLVAAAWNRKSGEAITRGQAWEIAKAAERKLRVALADVAQEVLSQ